MYEELCLVVSDSEFLVRECCFFSWGQTEQHFRRYLIQVYGLAILPMVREFIPVPFSFPSFQSYPSFWFLFCMYLLGLFDILDLIMFHVFIKSWYIASICMHISTISRMMVVAWLRQTRAHRLVPWFGTVSSSARIRQGVETIQHTAASSLGRTCRFPEPV